MKKSTLQNVLPLAVLMVTAAFNTACEKGGARTPEGAVLKAKCERGFNTTAENQKLAEALSKNTSVEADIAIRTYVTKFDIQDAAKESLLNPNSVNIVSTQKKSEFLKAPQASGINLTKDCANLTASVSGPGFKIDNLEIKDVKLQSIELKRMMPKQAGDQTVLEEITVKIEKDARLQAQEIELKKQIDDKSVKDKHILKAALKSAKEAKVARGNVVTKITIDLKGANNQSYVIEQYSGELFDDAQISFDPSVLKMIKERTSSVGTPNFIDRALVALEADKNGSELGKLTGEAAPTVQPVVDPAAKTIDEAFAVTELKEKLEAGLGLAAEPAKETAAAPKAEVKE